MLFHTADSPLEDYSNNKNNCLWIYLHRYSKLGPRAIWIRQKDQKLEEQCRTLCDKVVRHRMERVDIDHSPIKSPKVRERPSTKVLSCFSNMTDVLIEAHPELYSDIIFKLNIPLQDERAVCKAYCDFAEQLFSKNTTWSLIASLLAFSSELAVECTKNGRSILVRNVCDWATIFIVMRLKKWVKENGDWDGVLTCLASTSVENSAEPSVNSLKNYFFIRKAPNFTSSFIFLLVIFMLTIYISVSSTFQLSGCHMVGSGS